MQLLADGFCVDPLVAKLHDGRRRPDLQRRDLLQIRDERVGEADREEVVARVVRDVVERKDGHRTDGCWSGSGGGGPLIDRCACLREIDCCRNQNDCRRCDENARQFRAMHRLADEASRMGSQRVPRRRRDEDFEVGEQFPRVLIAIGGILLQQLADDLRAAGGNCESTGTNGSGSASRIFSSTSSGASALNGSWPVAI